MTVFEFLECFDESCIISIYYDGKQEYVGTVARVTLDIMANRSIVPGSCRLVNGEIHIFTERRK